MQKLTAQDPETKSSDLLAENIETLKALFPEVFSEGKIDFDILKQLLGGTVDEREEKYGLNWHGKRRARQLALTPSTGTLRPCPEESVDWNTTQNLMIEGDNLEVLKLLQKSYVGKVKLIYIDPPYNTGKDFVYPDNFQDNIRNYLELTGQVADGKKISSNTEASGRFHTDWLNMMYPRLKLARNLLRDDGVIFISIDDNEVSNLRKICDEIFGEENFVNLIAVKMSEATGVKMAHVEKRLPKLKEYLVLYKRAEIQLTPTPVPKGNWDSEYKHLICGVTREEIARLKAIMDAEDIPSDAVREADEICSKIFIRPINHLYSECNATSDQEKTGALFNNAWRIVRDVATTGGAKVLADQKKRQTSSPFFIIITPQKKAYLIKRDYSDDAEQPRIKLLFADDYLTQNPGDFWQDIKTTGLDNEGEVDFRNGKKPLKMVERMLQATTDKSDIILDFFAGSGTTGHAVWDLNRQDKGSRRFILIQLPEPTERKDHLTIADITQERLRRAGKKIREENPMSAGDIGFRVFKLASSNIRAWEPDRENLAQTLQEAAEHLKTDRTEQDILYEVLLKRGIDLCTPIEQRTIADKTVHSIGAGTLLVCLADHILREELEPLAFGIIEWHKELSPAGEIQVVFRDSAFADDVTKTNLTEILKQHGLENVRSL